MVNTLEYIKALMRLIRLPNLIIIAATQILLRQCVLLPMLKICNMELQLPGALFTLLVLSTVFIAAGGYAINDYFDRKIDRVNKPQLLIVGRLIYPRHAMIYHAIFTAVGVLFGIAVAFFAHLLYLSLVFLMVSGLLWFYSTTYKRQLLLGNIIVALLTALVPVMVLLFELPLLTRVYSPVIIEVGSYLKYMVYWVSGFAVFAFLLNLTREIIKDTEDFEGDQAYGKQTLPVILGLKFTKYIIAFLIISTCAMLALAYIWFVPDVVTLIYFVGTLIIPMIIIVIMLFKASDKKTFHAISILVKMVMVSGLLYMVIVNLLIRKFS
jgi:4-hydroxybenzoate polyprenyltransferase